MQTHPKFGGYSEDHTETYAEQQGDHGGIIVPAEVMGHDYPCPDSDENDDGGYYWPDDTGDDDSLSQAGNMGGKLGRHAFTNDSCSAGV